MRKSANSHVPLIYTLVKLLKTSNLTPYNFKMKMKGKINPFIGRDEKRFTVISIPIHSIILLNSVSL